MRLVFVEWLDSFGCSSDWKDLSDFQAKPLTCFSVGWLVYDGEECKVVVPHISDQNNEHVSQQGCGDMTIPTKAILRIVDLILPSDLEGVS